MQHRVVIVTANPELEATATALIRENALPVGLMFAAMDDEISTVHKAVAAGAEVIVGRGQLVSTFPQSLDVPIVKIEVSAFDLLQTLLQINHKGGPVAVVGFKDVIVWSEELSRILGFPLVRKEVASVSEAMTVLEQLEAEGIRDVVGTFGLVNKARLFGLKALTIKSGPESLLKAVREARHIANLYEGWKKRTEMLRCVADTVREGILSTDKDDTIILFNPAAEEIFKLDAENVLGKKAADIFPSLRLQKTLLEGEAQTSAQLEVRGKQMLCKAAPVRIGRKSVGVVACLQEITELLSLQKLVQKTIKDQGLIAKTWIRNIVGESQAITRLRQQAERYAVVDHAVLIMGETGTGKELLAQGIHNASRRAKGPFVAVNCAAFSSSLLESELFGYEEGAFTGAKRGGSPGLFETAHQGTIFLDEIGEMPLDLQAKLLRVLQERSFLKVGGKRPVTVDTRILAATNKNLRASILAAGFRADLYYRLNTLPLLLPPLRDRPEDIPLLARHFLARDRAGLAQPRVAHKAMVRLQQYSWPGNVRELENFVERLLLLAPNTISVSMVQEQLDEIERIAGWEAAKPEAAFPPSGPALPLPSSLPSSLAGDIPHILAALEAEGGNMVRAAKRLNISRTTIWRKLKQAGLKV